MKNKIIIALAFLLLASLLVGCVRQVRKEMPFYTEIPQPVLTKYVEMGEQYNNSLGANLQFCEVGDRNLFVVIGSGGFSGINYYYDANGNLLSSYVWDDMIEPNEPQPPFDIDYSKCRVLK